jgi:hypothetical protein
VATCLGTGASPKFAQDGRDVVVDRPRRQVQAFGDLRVPQVLTYQRQHVSLALSQMGEIPTRARAWAARQRAHAKRPQTLSHQRGDMPRP